MHLTRRVLILLAALAVALPAAAQQGRGGGAQAPQVTSPEVQPDRRIIFRILAPQAQAVRLAAGDIPGVGQTTQLAKGENGIWEVTVGPVDPGAYRYNFNVDGVSTIDPRSPFISESNNNVWSLVTVPGSDVMDTKAVPHGSVAAVTYYSTALGTFRRMHVYTPPGYERSSDKYPVFYLLHGAGDNDNAWSTVGRAGFIIDNLIAARKAKPMIVVMPAGHTRRGAQAGGAIGRSATDEFVKDFVTDVKPYVEKTYRVLADRAHTAIAGLSMGGNHTLQVAIPNLDKFGYIGVYSSGLPGAGRRPSRRATECRGPCRDGSGRSRSRRGGASTRGTSRSSGADGRRLGKGQRGDVEQRGVEEGAQGLLVRDRQGGFPPHHDERDGRLVQEARLRAGVQGISRRSHLDQLARLLERIRADAVSVISDVVASNRRGFQEISITMRRQPSP